MQEFSKPYADAAGGRFSGKPHCWVASQLVTPDDESSGFGLDDMNWPLFRCIL